ncbi:MAG: APC family permease [Waterburya sp.]
MINTLKQNALSLFDTITLAVAGSAPSYSLNATTAPLVAAVGVAAPGALLYGAIPMFGIAFAFMYLNRWRADAGAGYAWVGRSLNPYLGFMAGWTFLTLSTAFLVTAALPIGVTTLALLAPQYQDNVTIATIVAGIWLSGVGMLTILGVDLATRFQRIMTAIEVFSLLALIIGGFIKFSQAPVQSFSWAWFSPTAFVSFQTFVAGMTIAAFYYFGWDITSNVAEETQHSQETPGNSGVIGMIGVFLLLVLVQIMTQMGLGADVIEKNSANLFAALGNAIFPRPWGTIAVLAVLVSTVGTTETQLTQCSRMLFSMGRDRAISRRFEEVHPHFKTPWLAGLTIVVLGLFLLVLSSANESISAIMTNLISAIGVMVSFYYGAVGLACAWYYRKTMRNNWRTFLGQGVWSVGSAIALFVIALVQLPQLGLEVAGWTLAALSIGIIPMLYYRLKYRSSFYSDQLEYNDPKPRSRDLAQVP